MVKRSSTHRTTDGDDFAFPVGDMYCGITIRAKIATAILGGLAVHASWDKAFMAKEAVALADLLIEELNK